MIINLHNKLLYILSNGLSARIRTAGFFSTALFLQKKAHPKSMSPEKNLSIASPEQSLRFANNRTKKTI
jgi:hypothetical protein